MPTPTSNFDFDLPNHLIAQTPATPRESARLMVLNKKTHSIEHMRIADLPRFFNAGDIVVVNNSKVFKARLSGTIQTPEKVTRSIELFLIRPLEKNQWLALGKPGKKLIRDIHITIGVDFSAKILRKNDDGTLVVEFPYASQTVIDLCNRYGSIPTPPYIKTLAKEEDYQTSYATVVGSVAAPTAGFHLTSDIRNALRNMQVTIVEITLHVGLGTFQPMKTQDIENHVMHSEWVEISEEVAETLNSAKKQHRRIIAIGTTSVRTLEGVALRNAGKLCAYTGDINIFITPGFTFQVVDALLTNFHLPKSTLLVLISAFAGSTYTRNAYIEAVRNKYRFFSFGDAMFIYE